MDISGTPCIISRAGAGGGWRGEGIEFAWIVGISGKDLEMFLCLENW
jgi:hypothetical protein